MNELTKQLIESIVIIAIYFCQSACGYFLEALNFRLVRSTGIVDGSAGEADKVRGGIGAITIILRNRRLIGRSVR